MRFSCLMMLLFLLDGCTIPSSTTSSFAYIDIEEMKLESGKANFTDAWLFLDGKSNGVYELPRLIPVVTDLPVNVSIQAGIRENGINSSPRAYPFTGNYEFELDLADGEVLPLTPVFNYLPAAKIRLDADFDDQNFFGFDADGIDSIRIELTENGEGLIKLAGGEVLQEATTIVIDELPRNGSPVYLEIEYRGDLDLDIGLLGIAGGEVFKDYFVSLRSKNEWNKAYINFTDLIIASDLSGYQILLGADHSNGTSEAKIYIDNIKLLHF